MNELEISAKVSGLAIDGCVQYKNQSRIIFYSTYIICLLLKKDTNDLVLDNWGWSILIVIQHPKVIIGSSFRDSQL